LIDIFLTAQINNFLNRTVLLTAFFFTALFTTVHAADINLALGRRLPCVPNLMIFLGLGVT
jgi:hypothetical protein